MVSSAYGVEDPPPELTLAWKAKKYSALPMAGGLFTQPYALLHKMDVFSNVYSIVGRLQNLTGANIHKLSDGERRVIKWLRDIKVM